MLTKIETSSPRSVINHQSSWNGVQIYFKSVRQYLLSKLQRWCACQRNFQLCSLGMNAYIHIVRIIRHCAALCFSAIWEETAAVIFLLASPGSKGNLPLCRSAAPRHTVGVRASQMWSSVLGRVWHYLTCDLNISTQSKMMHYLSVTMSNLLQRYLAAFFVKTLVSGERASLSLTPVPRAANITTLACSQAQIKKKKTDAHTAALLSLSLVLSDVNIFMQTTHIALLRE